MIDNNALANILFADLDGTVSSGETSYFEELYPCRDLPQGAFVTRLGPSPTGFIHLGNLFMAYINMKLARQSSGRFLLRVEDTDRKREVEGAVESLINSLAYFDISFDEGVKLASDNCEIIEEGNYGPYFQSARRALYRTFAKKLVEEGKAYPCFLAEEEINTLREKQESEKLLTGIYGEYAKYRDVNADEAKRRIDAGETFVLRLNADAVDTGGSKGETFTIVDGIRGELTMPKNIMDVVILKADGLPTYHFAHAMDDHFMGTTHVIRGEEWLSSLPIHKALFDALGFDTPVYCHTALLMKMDGETKRKLSKRMDPELALSYYIAEGYHPAAIEEYLLTIINSNYEEWRIENADADTSEFEMTTEKMGVSGILFDLDKLRNVSANTLVRIPAEALADFMTNWAKTENPEAFEVYTCERATLVSALDIGRSGDKPRKDLEYAAQIFDFTSYFFDEFFTIKETVPSNIPAEDVPVILTDYLASYNHTDDRSTWFDKIREIAVAHNYAAKPKDFKKNPDQYKGHVGDVSTIIRVALVGRTNSPDVYEIQQILGEEKVRTRIQAMFA